MRKPQKRSKNKITPIILILLNIFFIYNISRAIINTQNKIGDFKQVESETEALREEYFQTYIKTKEVNTDDYLEKFSRNEMNYAKDGDIIFFINEDALNSKLLDIEYQKIINGYNSNSQPTVKQWIHFIKNGV